MKKYTKGFTLIELLVVIAIIGILASIVLVSLNSARNKGKDTRVVASVQQMRTLAESAYSGTDYSAVFDADNVTITSGDGISDTDATALQLIADVEAQGSSIFAITDTGPFSYAIFGLLTSQVADTYFCIDSAGRTSQAVTTTTPTIACQ